MVCEDSHDHLPPKSASDSCSHNKHPSLCGSEQESPRLRPALQQSQWPGPLPGLLLPCLSVYRAAAAVGGLLQAGET